MTNFIDTDYNIEHKTYKNGITFNGEFYSSPKYVDGAYTYFHTKEMYDRWVYLGEKNEVSATELIEYHQLFRYLSGKNYEIDIDLHKKIE